VNAEGYYNLGIMYKDGIGVKTDFGRALKLLKSAAEQPPYLGPPLSAKPRTGVIEAQHSLGLCYHYGTGVPKDIHQAIGWYERAVTHRNPFSANNLGMIYIDGTGVPRDVDKGVSLLNMAAEGNDVNAMINLSNYHKTTGNRRMAFEWMKRAADGGHVEAQLALADFWPDDLRDPPSSSAVLSPSDVFDLQAIRFLLSTMEELGNSGKAYPSSPMTAPYRFDPEMLQKHAAKGSSTAAMLLKAVRRFFKGLRLFCTEGSDDSAVLEFGEAIRITDVVCPIPQALKENWRSILPPMIAIDKKSDLDRAARYCWILAEGNDLDALVSFFDQCTRNYPEEQRFWDFRVCNLAFKNDWEQALRVVIEGRVRHPTDPDLMLSHAKVLTSLGKVKEARELYEEFLKCAASDHRFFPKALYALAMFSVMDKTPNIEEQISQCREAEKRQLPCFLPYQCRDKEALEKLLSTKHSFRSTVTDFAEKESQQKRKARLEDPRRVDLFRNFNNAAAGTHALLQGRTKKTTLVPAAKAKAPKRAETLKWITLKEMDPGKDFIHKGRILSLTVIADGHSTGSSISALVEDDFGESTRFFVYNDLSFDLKVGDQLTVSNPYHRIAADLRRGIRVDDPKTVEKTGRILKACNACCAPDSPNACSRCKVPYCSRECQVLDWNHYAHNLVCQE